VLTYDSASGKWVALTPASSTDMAAVWSALAAADSSKQIDISHLSNALSGYLPLTGGTMSNTNLVTNMNADMLDGYHIAANNTPFGNIPVITSGGFMDVGNSFEFHYDNTTGSDFSTRLYCTGNYSNSVALPSTSGTLALISDLSSYLPLAGGTMSNTNLVTNLNADLLDGYEASGLFTDFSNITTGADAGKVGITIGGTTRALAIDAATLGGTAKSGLFTSLTSTWATNLSATIGGTTLSVSSLNADYAGQLRYTRSIWGQNFNGTADVSGDLYLAGSNLRLFDYNNSADCYIVGYRTGSSRAIGVAVEGSSLFEFNDEEFYSAVGIYAASYVTALSDIRYKNVIRHFALDAETIANASLIQFKWIDGRDQATHVGGIAQEWQAFLPEAVHETKDGKLSMDYGVIAYTAAVSLAKKVIAQQQEIDDLKQRLERLERIIDKVTK
jgi:hypothetical protein